MNDLSHPQSSLLFLIADPHDHPPGASALPFLRCFFVFRHSAGLWIYRLLANPCAFGIAVWPIIRRIPNYVKKNLNCGEIYIQ
jgi:hypothetical protein